MVQAKTEVKVKTQAESDELRAKFMALSSMFNEVASRNIRDKHPDEVGIFKKDHEYKSKKRVISPKDAAKVLASATKVAIFTGDII
jgi:hypothetical protein